MGQQRDPSSEATSDSVAEASPSFVERHFWSILMGVALLAAGAGSVVAYMQYGQVDRALRAVPYADQAGQLASALPYVGGADSAATGRQEYGSFTRMEGLVVNPSNSDGNRYLAVSLAFESASSGAGAEIESKKVVVKDTILAHLSKQTVEELSNPGRREELKTELLEATNHILGGEGVDRLYFTEFVLQ
jgi:flagellar FliL protein